MNSKGKPLIYVQMKKALYGLLLSTLLFYRKSAKDLEAYGFQINPYDPCVTKNMIKNKRMTVVWNLKKLKVSLVYSFEINSFQDIYQAFIEYS